MTINMLQTYYYITGKLLLQQSPRYIHIVVFKFYQNLLQSKNTDEENLNPQTKSKKEETNVQTS